MYVMGILTLSTIIQLYFGTVHLHGIFFGDVFLTSLGDGPVSITTFGIFS
jgi:hypothetical protein